MTEVAWRGLLPRVLLLLGVNESVAVVKTANARRTPNAWHRRLLLRLRCFDSIVARIILLFVNVAADDGGVLPELV